MNTPEILKSNISALRWVLYITNVRPEEMAQIRVHPVCEDCMFLERRGYVWLSPKYAATRAGAQMCADWLRENIVEPHEQVELSGALGAEVWRLEMLR